MLRWEALERPNFLKLKKLFQDENDRLALNIDNKTFCDDLINNVMKMHIDPTEEEYVDEIDPEDEDGEGDDEETIQFTQEVGNNLKNAGKKNKN